MMLSSRGAMIKESFKLSTVNKKKVDNRLQVNTIGANSECP